MGMVDDVFGAIIAIIIVIIFFFTVLPALISATGSSGSSYIFILLGIGLIIAIFLSLIKSIFG